MTVQLFGISNCDTVKKARVRLEGAGQNYAFHDYKKAGVDAEKLDSWISRVGWETLLNRAGTTFRKLPEADRADLDEAKARMLMIAYPSLIKRPVVEQGGELLIGFKSSEWTAAGL